MTKEKLMHHLEHLAEKHMKLDDEIDHMENTGSFVDEELTVLKKQRLRLKDEMESVKERIKTFG